MNDCPVDLSKTARRLNSAVRRPTRSLCLAAGLATLAAAVSFAAPPPRPAKKPAPEVNVDWQVVKYEGRDYLTLENIARFYRLKGNLVPDGKKFFLSNGSITLETTVDGREMIINGVKQWLSFPVRWQDGKLLVSRFDLAKTIEPAMRPHLVTQLKPFKTVVIDAGHGGHDKGAASRQGFEKDYTLMVSKELKTILEKRGVRCILTRDTDIFLPLEERARRANAVPDSIFVCVHFNASADVTSSATGFEVFALAPRGAPATHDEYTYADLLAQLPGHEHENAGLALATSIQHALVGELGEFDRGVKRARFAVLKLTRSASVLVEGGFLNNVEDGKQIHDPLWRRQLAESIADGIVSYGGLAAFRRPPKMVADYRAERLPGAGRLVRYDTPSVFPPSEVVPSGQRTVQMLPRED